MAAISWDALVDKFVIKCNRNTTSKAILSVPVSVTEEDNNGEPKAKKKGPVEANKSGHGWRLRSTWPAQSMAPVWSTPIVKGFQEVDEIELEKKKKQFTTAFFVAKEERPFTDFPKLLELWKVNFVEDLTQHCIAESEREEFHKMVHQSDQWFIYWLCSSWRRECIY